MVLLSGHAPVGQLGRGAFQEMSQADMASPVTKASWTATDASQLGHDLARALGIAKSGRPGPVHLTIPVDLLEAPVMSEKAMPRPDEFESPASAADGPAAEQIIDALAKAKRPLVLAGPGSHERWWA